MKRIAFALCVIGCLALIAILVAGALLSAPVKARVGAPPPDLSARDVSFVSASGVVIRGWLALPKSAPCASVVLFPGVRANRSSMVDRARFLRNVGYAVLLLDLRGTGESGGDRITFGWDERHDVRAAVAFVRSQVPRRPVALLGSSLGGAAILLAAPDLHVDAVVLEAVYPTIERATENRLRIRGGTLAAYATPLLLMQMPLRIDASSNDLRPLDHIAKLNCPVFVVAGDSDRHTTPDDTRLLYTAAHAPKQLWLVPDAAHVDLHRHASTEYERRVLTFLRDSLPDARCDTLQRSDR